MKIKHLLFTALVFVSSFSFAQTYTLGHNTNAGTFTTCGGTFVDEGGAGNYSNGNTSSKITFCPGTPGDVIKINFTGFNTQGSLGPPVTCTDVLHVWYANTVGATGTDDDQICGPLGSVSIISTNANGCISFMFTSDGSSVAAGWSGAISCVTPCGVLPTSALTDNSTLNICSSSSLNPGSTTVAFDASPSSVPSPRTISSYEWEWGDGTTSTTTGPTTTHTYPSSGVFIARLFVRDNNFDIDPLGCRSTNATTKIIKIVPAPNFTGTTASTVNVSCGGSATLTGVAASQTATSSLPTVNSVTTPLPDGSGNSYVSGVDYSSFFPNGATVSSGCYPTVCINLEHTYSGDLTIDLIAPSGETVRLYDRAGSAIHFGTCSKAADDGVPGCGANYCFVNSGGAAYTTTTTTTTCSGYSGTCEAASYYVAGTYNSSSAMTALNGADLNGVWSIKVTDNLNLDDGTLFSWNISFPLACYNTLESITPDMSTAVWTNGGGGPAVPAQTPGSTVVTDPGPGICPTPGTCVGNKLTNTITVGPFNTGGTYPYNFTVTDEFGCQYLKTINVVAPAGPTFTVPANIVQCGGTTVAAASFTSVPAGATFTWANSAPAIGLAASGSGSVPSFTATNSTGAPITATITVTATPSSGCPTVHTYTITINPLPISTYTQSANQCLTGNTFTFTNTGSVGAAYTNSWSFAGGTPATSTASSPSGVTFATTGAHSITHTTTATGGCTATSTSTITIFAMPTGSITAQTNVLCNGGNTGSVTVAGASTSGYSYSINGGSTFQASGTFSALSAGSYTVTIKDVNGCSVTVPVTITQPAALTGSITAQTNILCNGGATGSVTVAGAGGTPGYTYAKDGVTFGASGTFSSLTAGAYTITVKDINGCTITVPVTITQPTVLTGSITAQTNVLCNGGATGSVTVAGAGGTSLYSYAIDGVTFTASGTFSSLAAGAYTITVKDANGCIKTVPVTITQPPLLTVAATKTDATCGASNGSITATGAGGSGSYSYSINGTTFQASGSFASQSAGSYTITVKDANGCIKTTTITINDLSGLSGSITAQTNVNCASANNGSVTVAGAGTSGYTYSINGTTFQASGTFSSLAPGPYTITVKDINGCTVTVPVTITTAAAVTGSITAQTNVLCNGNSTGSVTVTGNSGTPGYTYSKDGITFGASGTFSSLAAGSYTITVKDVNGCTTTVPVTITQPTLLTGSITAQTNILCNGSSTGSVTVAGAGGTSIYSYAIDGVTFTASGTFSSLAAGAYTITVKDANGCIKTVPVTITQPPLLTVAATKTDATCGASNGSITATGAGGSGSYSYSINGTTFQASGSFTSQSAGSYTITVKDANGCIKTTTISIVDLSGLVASVSGQTDVSCFGGNNGSFTVTASGSTGPYSYSSDATTYQASGTFSSLAAGSYTITAKDANSCTTTVSVTITQPPVLSASISAQTNVSCFGANNGSITIVATGGTTSYLYAIDGGAPVSAATFTGLTAATHTVIVKDGKGCTTTVTVIITQPTALTLTTSSVNSICTAANGSATVTASGGTPPYSYLWSNSQTGATANNIPAGNYSVLVTDNNGCTQTGLVTVNANPGGTATISSIVDITCTGANNGSATVSMGGASTPPFSYAWNPSSQATSTATNLSPSTYTITVTDGNGCIATATVVITEPGVITTSFVSTNVTCNGGNNGQSTATVGGGTFPYTYLWLPGGQTTPTATNLVADTYTLTVTDKNNCTKVSTTTISEPSAMVLSSTHVDANCNQSNGSATITATGGTGPYTYSWGTTPVQTGQTATSLAANSYMVTVTDNNACSQSLVVTINDIAGPVATLVSTTNASCFGQNNGSATTTVNGGTSPYTFAWNNGQTLPTATNLVAGTYTMTATDQQGCIASVSASITEPNQLVTTYTSVNPSCFAGNNGSINTNTNGGTTPYTYLWSPGAASTNNISNLTAGTYTLQVTDSNNCTTLTPVTLTEPAPVTATASSQNVTCSGLCNGTTTATPGAGNGPFTYLWTDPNAQTTQIATGLCGGTYTVTVKDDNGCTAIATAYVTVPNAMVAAIPTFTDVSCFGACDGSAQSTVTGGTAPYTYNWNIGPLGTQGASVNNLCAGSYIMTVTDVNGCQVSASQTIQQPPPLTSSITHTDVTCYGMCDAQATAVYTGGTGPYTFSWTPSMQTTPTVLNLCAGVQTMVITDSHNCSANSTVVIQEPSVLSVSTTATTSNCGNADGGACAQITGGTPPFIYSWNDPASQTTSCAINLNANAYTISVTDAHGCSVTNVANVNDITGPVVTIPTSTNVTCAGANDGTAQGNISGGALPYASVLWTPSGQTSSFATGLAGGQYSLMVTDASGCRGSNTVSITEPFPLVAGIVHTNASCNLVCDGSATVNVGGGTAPYGYAWNDPAVQTTAIASSLCAQTYIVTVTDANGCIKTASTTVDQPTPLTITQTAFTNVSCNGGSNGSVTTSVAGGTPGYTYLWSPGNQANSQATNLSVGSYTLLVTDAHQCSQTFVQNITEPSALVLTPNSNPSKCGNSDGSAGVSVTAGTGTAPYTYFWSPTGLTSAIIANVSAGSYTVTVTDANACTSTATSIVANLSGPVINNVTPSTPLCYNTPTGSATVSVSGGQLPYNYSWSNSAGTLGQNSATATALVDGVYSVTVTDLNGCSQTGSVIVQPATPVVILPIPTDTICIGQSSQIYGAASGGTPNYTYTWNPPFTGQPGPIYNVSPTTTTVYSVTALDEHGCLSNMQTATVFVHQQIKVIATDTSICSGQSVPISAVATQGTGGPYTYTWSNGATSQTQTVTPAGTGGTVNYIVTANDIGCSTAVTDTATVTINTLPFASMNTLDTAGCEAFNAAFIGNSNGVSYLWNFGDGNTSSLQNPSHMYTTTGGILTSYNVSLTVTSALGCVSVITNNAFIDVYPTPVAGFTSSPSQPTTTSPVVSFNDQSTGATDWNWDFIYTTPPLGLYTDTLQNPMFSYPDSGTYVVQQVVSNIYGCYDTAYHTVEIIPEYILYTPNAFTPFNHDGINDVFMPKGLGIDPDHFEMMIFDRWGNLIFKTTDITKGWNGKANGGSNVAQADVYVWKIITKDYRGNNHNYIGHVSIVR